jgi:hypothetical protein
MAMGLGTAGLGTAGFLGAAGLAGAAPGGAGAGCADRADEMTSEAAMVAITIRIDEGIGINVTGSEKKEARISTACGAVQCKPNPLMCPSIQHKPAQARWAHRSLPPERQPGGCSNPDWACSLR